MAQAMTSCPHFMVMDVLAAGMEVDDETLNSLRDRCVQNVKKTGGAVTFDEAVKYQRGDELLSLPLNNVAKTNLLL